MFNHYPYNHALYSGDNLGFTRNTTPSYSPSIITAVAQVEQGIAVPKFLIGGRGGSTGTTHSLQKKSSSYSFSMWKSGRFSIGKKFNIDRIELQLTAALQTDTLIIPILDFDDGERRIAGNDINLLNYQDAPEQVVLTPYNFDGNVHGNRNFCLELHFRGVSLIGVSLPIVINLETEEYG